MVTVISQTAARSAVSSVLYFFTIHFGKNACRAVPVGCYISKNYKSALELKFCSELREGRLIA